MYLRLIRNRIAVISIACAVLPMAVSTVPATVLASSATGSPPSSVAGNELMARQAPYMELDQKVRALAAIDVSPLAGTRLDVAGGRLFVYWAGDPPASLTALRQSAQRSGISLVVERARFSERQLKDAANVLGTFAEAQKLELRTSVHIDGSGLTVEARGLATAAAGSTAARTTAQSQVLAAIDAVRGRTGIPVRVADASDAQPQPANRNSDWTPFWAGAQTDSANTFLDPDCTSGFSLYNTGNATRYMLTAAHCTGWADDIVVENGVNQRMGVSDFIHELFDIRADRYDLGVIRLDAGLSNQGRAYSQWTIANGLYVKGYAAGGIPANGNYCVSGAVSVPNCNLLSGGAVHICSFVPFGRCVWYISFTSINEGIVACLGDSGGPVYYHQGIPTQVIAAGAVGFLNLPPGQGQNCGTTGGVSVVATAINLIPGLGVVTS